MSSYKSRQKTPEFIRYYAGLGAIGIALIAPAGVSNAQGADGGVVVDLSLSQTVRASDNEDLEDPAVGEVKSITSLDGSISSITRSQSFILGFSIGAELGNEGFLLDDTGVDAMYVRSSQSAQLELNARYFRKEVTSEITGDDLESDV
ncbi:MAG: hypothetical protein AAGO57_03600, partial [Pseudomonadota bacterium]